MSTPIGSEHPQAVKGDALEAAIVAVCRLSDEAVKAIHLAMEASQLQFGEAAVTYGAITQREHDEAVAWAIEQTTRPAGDIFGTAFRRQALTRTGPPRNLANVEPGPKLTLVHDPFSKRSEHVRGLRTELLLLGAKRDETAVMALLSPNPGEGRSLLAAELAIAFAQLGRRTLLVDADLRSPSIHTLFGHGNPWGLGQALSSAERPGLLGVEGTPQLSVLTSGPVVPNPLEMLCGGGFARLIAGWRQDFNFILIDTPPVSQFSDALAIASVSDGIILLSRAATTKHRDMKGLVQRLGATQARILGAIINRF